MTHADSRTDGGALEARMGEATVNDGMYVSLELSQGGYEEAARRED
jgi:hypothetical protein